MIITHFSSLFLVSSLLLSFLPKILGAAPPSFIGIRVPAPSTETNSISPFYYLNIPVDLPLGLSQVVNITLATPPDGRANQTYIFSGSPDLSRTTSPSAE